MQKFNKNSYDYPKNIFVALVKWSLLDLDAVLFVLFAFADIPDHSQRMLCFPGPYREQGKLNRKHVTITAQCVNYDDFSSDRFSTALSCVRDHMGYMSSVVQCYGHLLFPETEFSVFKET